MLFRSGWILHDEAQARDEAEEILGRRQSRRRAHGARRRRDRCARTFARNEARILRKHVAGELGSGVGGRPEVAKLPLNLSPVRRRRAGGWREWVGEHALLLHGAARGHEEDVLEVVRASAEGRRWAACHAGEDHERAAPVDREPTQEVKQPAHAVGLNSFP